MLLAPKPGVRIHLCCVPGTRKSRKDLALFLRLGCDLLIVFMKNESFVMVNDDPISDKFVVGAHTCGNSGLCRSYITDSKRERKIVKICGVGNIGSGAQT